MHPVKVSASAVVYCHPSYAELPCKVRESVCLGSRNFFVWEHLTNGELAQLEGTDLCAAIRLIAYDLIGLALNVESSQRVSCGLPSFLSGSYRAARGLRYSIHAVNHCVSNPLVLCRRLSAVSASDGWSAPVYFRLTIRRPGSPVVIARFAPAYCLAASARIVKTAI